MGGGGRKTDAYLSLELEMRDETLDMYVTLVTNTTVSCVTFGNAERKNKVQLICKDMESNEPV